MGRRVVVPGVAVRRGLAIVAALALHGGCDSPRPPSSAGARLGLPSTTANPSPRTPRPDPALVSSLAASPVVDDVIRLVGGSDGVLVLRRADAGAPVPSLAPASATTIRTLDPRWTAGWMAVPDGQTVVLEVDGITVAGTPGALPGPRDTRPLPESPRACGDRLFPARVAGDLATCTEPGSLDRWGRRPLPAGLDPRHAAPAPWGIAVATGKLGIWAPIAPRLVPFRARAAGRPGAAGGLLVIAAPDRLEFGEAGSARRSVVGARPMVGRGAPAISAEHVAWIDGHRAPRLMLRRVAPPAVAVWPGTTDPSRPQLSDGWMTFVDGAHLRGVGLRGQQPWEVPVDCGFTDGHAGFDDWRMVPDRTGDRLQVLAVHLPTGAVLPAWGDDDWVRLRGADPSGLTAQLHRPGDPGRLAERRTGLRLLEEDGALASAALPSLVGGHGGRHGLLAAGRSHRVTVPAGPAGRLSVWMPAGALDGTVRAEQNGALVGSIAAPDHAHDAWITLGAIAHGAPITVTWTAAASSPGFAVDALRIDQERP